jgi:N6-L-threonylcarbamoyladenine synthase
LPSAIAPTNSPIILGIETSCDETAVAIVQKTGPVKGNILANVIRSQIDEHAAFGGVVPEIAARAHVSVLDHLCRQAITEAGLDWSDLDGIAATTGPGLIGGVIVGLTTAKTLAMALDKPLLAINHLEGHALTARLTDQVPFPYLLLLVSGGHTQILLVEELGQYHRLASTIDDAVGEAFDKTAKLLSLSNPGGPHVEAAARQGDPTTIPLPKPLLHAKSLDMSFSGLKTAVRQAAEDRAPLSATDVANLCASFQASVAAVLENRLVRALPMARERTGQADIPTVVAGGVAANQHIREILRAAVEQAGSRFIAPPPALCTDNAAMIAWAGAERYEAGLVDPLDIPARSRWPLDQHSAPKMGFGRRGAKV